MKHGGHRWLGFWTSVLKPIGHKIKANEFEANHVIDDIYLGSVNDAANLEMLRDTLQITHVVSCVLGLRPLYPGIFKYLIVPLRDVADEPLEPYFESTIHFIDSALAGGGRVFVHCMKGVSRSASMVIAWLMARKGLPLNEAFTFLKSRRPLVSPNEGFMQQLAMFGETLNRRPSLAQSTPSFSAHVSLGGGNAARVKSLKVQRRNSTVVLGSSRASSPPPMRRSYSRPDVLISEPNLKIGEMDAQDKSDWASLEACYGGVSVMSKFENHVPALISPHPKSAPAKFGGNDNNDDANMHKSKKEIDGDWPAGNASAEPPQPPSSAKAAGPIPKTLSPRKHKEPELRSSHGQNWNEAEDDWTLL